MAEALDWLQQLLGGGQGAPQPGGGIGALFDAVSGSPTIQAMRAPNAGAIDLSAATGLPPAMESMLGAERAYDPSRSFAANALDPRSIEQAMNIAMSTGPGAIREGWTNRLATAVKAGDVSTPKSVLDAKYIMPDGRLVGSGDEAHEYIAHLLGYGTRGEASVANMLRDTGATRVGIANALFDKAAPAIDMYHPPTPRQMSQIDSYLKQSGGANVSFGDQYGRVERGSDLARMIAEGRR